MASDDGRDPELDELLSSVDDEGGARRLSEISVASAKVAAIVEAAERAAEEMRIKTEDKVRSRIAEADRAVDLRVEAAEAEAREILDAARAEAAGVEAEARENVRAIHERAAQAREEGERRRSELLAEAQAEATRVRNDAAIAGEETTREAREEARAILAEAHAAARGVLEDGTELSGHLSELSESLRRNAERLLNDVKLAHARLTADLDQATPPGTSIDTAPRASAAPSRRSRPSDDDFEVPEFLPGRR
jgi:cell division septum initiation protein DivIVA